MCEAKNTDDVRAGLLSSLSYPWKWSLTGETVCSIAQQQLGQSRWTDSQQVRWGKIRHTELDVLAIHGWLVVPSHLYLGFPSQWDQNPEWKMPGVDGKPPSRSWINLNMRRELVMIWWISIREEMLELRQRALNRLEEEGMAAFNPADVERLKNNDRYVER